MRADFLKKLLFFFIACALHTNSFSQNKTGYDYNIYKKINAPVHSYELISVLAKGNVAAIEYQTKLLGGYVKYGSGDIVSIMLPQNKLAAFAESGCARRMESHVPNNTPMNDTMRVRADVQQIHDGIAPLMQSYKGTGVVCGFIDTGVDFSHPDFKNPNGTSRIAWLWDHAKPNGPNTPQPYNYGQEWSNTDIDNGLCNHSDAPHYGHGTLSTGITAGNGLATGFNQGVAPEADIIMVAYDFSSPAPNRIADGINYIFTKAAAMGKPCVINLSLGDYYGSHDGLDLEAQLINNMMNAQPGRLVVAAAGNIGNDSIHVQTNLNTGDTLWTWYKYDPAFQICYIELWADDADMQNMQFAIGCDSNQISASFIGRTQYFDFMSVYWNLKKYVVANTSDTVLVYGDSYGGRSEIMFEIHTTDPSRLWRLISTGNGTHDVWHIQYSVYKSGVIKTNLPPSTIVPEIVDYVMPDRHKTVISSFACLENVITVGNYLNKNSNLDCSDTLRYNSPDIPGTLANNSGTGPTRDGRQKPDIAAPGNYIMAPIVLSLDTPTALYNPKINKGCYHKVAGGTSAAAPVVSGIGALYLQKNPAATPAQFRQAIITCGAKKDFQTGNNLPDYDWGYGKVDGFHTLTGCLAGLYNDFDQNIQVALYPNPIKDVATLSVFSNTAIDDISVLIYDLPGKCIRVIKASDFEVSGNKAQTIFTKTGISSGLYFYEVKMDNQLAAKGKLIIQ